jgi:phosphoglycolate phosphatase
MLKLIVFDWDGTLADSVSQILACKQYLAKKYGLPLPNEKIVRQVLGMPFEQALANCFPAADTILLHQLGQEFHTLMQQDEYQAALFPQAKETLLRLKKQGIKLAAATSKDRRELDKALRYHQLCDIFDITCCGKEYQEKPQPAMLMYMMQALQVEPSECLMIGDTVTDLLFAANAGVKAVGVTFGAHMPLALQSLHPFALISAWSQLSNVIDELCYASSHLTFCRL